MAPLHRRHFLAGIGAGALTGCSAPSPDRVAVMEDSIREGGIGGTGIVGTLTDFGSLIVNGMRITMDGGTDIRDTRGILAAENLRIGQTLTIEARRNGDGIIASRVEVTYPVVGPVSDVAPDGRSALVAGLRVRLEPSGIGGFEAGSMVAASGIWRGAEVVASRVDRVRARGIALLSGEVMESTDGVLRLGTTPLDGLTPNEATPGSFARIGGVYRGDRLTVETVTPDRFTGAAGPLVALSVEGYLDPAPKAPFYRVSGLGHSFDEASDIANFATSRTLFTGAYTGAFAVERGQTLPESFEARRATMRDLLNDG